MLASSVAEEVVSARPTTLSIDAVFRRHAGDVYRMVASLLGAGASDADIQDLTQEVFLQVHRSLDRFRGESKLETWLYAIATRVVLMHLRSWRRHRRLVKALEDEPTIRRFGDLERATVERAELLRVWRCLMKIGAEKRMVYVLFEVEGLSGREIAEILAINEATVRTRLFHARKELGRLLERSKER
jgi:RNA polymerase sigma-70 factor (ECF subfamily)